ncbi:MAG TPA: GAF domain-containing protein [Syntrophobacteria bacterium]|nr:GAF domain-containing protein [Syntrophobacteria bacterium]
MKKDKEFYYHKLYELAAALNSAHASETILHSMVEGVATAMGAKGCSLLLLMPDRKVLRHTVSFGLSERYTVKKGPLSADKSISEALGGEAVVVLDATKDERVQYPTENKKEGIASILSVPMMHRGDIIGVIRVYTGEPYDFTTDDKYFVWAIANLGAIALENARLYETVRKDHEELRREILEWRAGMYERLV